MTTIDRDPFTDPIHTVEDGSHVEGATLAVGRDASLTLATESLVVLGELDRHAYHCDIPDSRADEDALERRGTKCCGLFPNGISLSPLARPIGMSDIF